MKPIVIKPKHSSQKTDCKNEMCIICDCLKKVTEQTSMANLLPYGEAILNSWSSLLVYFFNSGIDKRSA